MPVTIQGLTGRVTEVEGIRTLSTSHVRTFVNTGNTMEDSWNTVAFYHSKVDTFLLNAHLTHWPMGHWVQLVTLNVHFTNACYGLIPWTRLVKLLLCDYHGTPLMRSKQWLRFWIGAINRQAVTWANLEPVLWNHMTSLGHDKMNNHL